MGEASLVNPAPLADGTKLPMDVHNTRLDALLGYVTSAETTANSTRWLERVRAHMRAPDPVTGTADDYEYLSRFEVTRRCSNGDTVVWQEWIEPVTITARHPFGFSSCRTASAAHQTTATGKGTPRVGRSNVDYVLLQSGRHLHDAQSPAGPGGRGRRRASGAGATKHVLLDAGTSTFDSSLYWFTCG